MTVDGLRETAGRWWYWNGDYVMIMGGLIVLMVAAAFGWSLLMQSEYSSAVRACRSSGGEWLIVGKDGNGYIYACQDKSGKAVGVKAE